MSMCCNSVYFKNLPAPFFSDRKFQVLAKIMRKTTLFHRQFTFAHIFFVLFLTKKDYEITLKLQTALATLPG